MSSKNCSFSGCMISPKVELTIEEPYNGQKKRYIYCGHVHLGRMLLEITSPSRLSTWKSYEVKEI